MTQPRKKRIFISYRSTDRAAVDSLVGDLNSNGEFEVWIDRQGIRGGQAWWDAILDAIEDSDVMIAALSNDALTSDACQKERAYALALGIPLIPVRIDPALSMTALPPEIATRQVLNYSGGKREYDALVDSLRAVGYYPGRPNPAPQRPAPPVAPPPPPPPPINRAVRLFVTIAVLTGLAIALILGGFAALGALQRGNSTPTPAPPTEVVVSATPQTAPTDAPATLPPTDAPAVASMTPPVPDTAGGAIAAALIYERDAALTFLLTDSADLSAVILRAADGGEVRLNDDFPFVVEEAARLGAGLCLRYVRASGELPPLPNDCNPDRVFTRRLADADVFWWDDAQNAARTLAVLNGATRIALCSGLPVRCELDGG